MHEGFSLELVAVRRILEPAATRLAAERMDDATLAELDRLLAQLEAAPTQAERMPFDAEFHEVVARRSDNATLASMLAAVSSRTVRARAWRGIADEAASAHTAIQHREILEALRARDPERAEAAALVHVAATEAWFKRAQGEQ
jgi:GntR family transcriptional repressor for pyruvate dehydrogenase complex